MKYYIVEDDPSVICILEDVIEQGELGRVCGTTEDGDIQAQRILAADPDIVVMDLLMPGLDGIQLTRELRESGCRARVVMLSQVSDKEMIARAYQAGVEFFVQKPLNLIEIRQVLGNVRRQLEQERALQAIQGILLHPQAPVPPASGRLEQKKRRLQAILSQLGMAGEKGGQDIEAACMYLLEREENASQISVQAVCGALSDTPKSMEQRMRRAAERGLRHLAHLGQEDYGNEIFVQYAARLFSFQNVRAEMAAVRGEGGRGKVNLKKFLDGLMILLTEE